MAEEEINTQDIEDQIKQHASDFDTSSTEMEECVHQPIDSEEQSEDDSVSDHTIEKSEQQKSKLNSSFNLVDTEPREAKEEKLSEEELNALFNKNTSSFRCLAQILLSRSSLLKHPLYYFPPLLDPGIDAAFNYNRKSRLTIVIKSLPTKELNLRYYGLTDKEFRAIANALNLNTCVEVLNLEENFLNPQSAYCIEELLRENNTLKSLNMKECRIGQTGAANLSEGIMLTQSLRQLDLSHNDLGTEGIQSLAAAFRDNSTIRHLNLGHNNLDLNAAPIIASILKENGILEELDLTWNNLGVPLAMKPLCEALVQNTGLRSLNLSWNGIMLKPAFRHLTKCMKKNGTLECLDLSNNRIGPSMCGLLKGALRKNKSLRALNLAFNILSPDNAYDLIDLMLSKNAPPGFDLLDLENLFVKKDCVPLIRRATRLGKRVNVTGILGNWVIKGPHIIKLLFDRAKLLAQKPKRKSKRKDFGHFVLSLPEKPMKKSAFEAAAKKFKMKMVDNDLLVEITKQFPYKKKAIDCVALKEKYLDLYPDTQPPPPKKKKGKKGKKKQGDAPPVNSGSNDGMNEPVSGDIIVEHLRALRMLLELCFSKLPHGDSCSYSPGCLCMFPNLF
ncbi:Leucine rich repeat [Popillia japonica]|uniref:Leucine rich repeat n=1 Tax=Popillia japonica TaxID=7064 RepID=A0AAW1HSC8_POPJA